MYRTRQILFCSSCLQIDTVMMKFYINISTITAISCIVQQEPITLTSYHKPISNDCTCALAFILLNITISLDKQSTFISIVLQKEKMSPRTTNCVLRRIVLQKHHCYHCEIKRRVLFFEIFVFSDTLILHESRKKCNLLRFLRVIVSNVQNLRRPVSSLLIYIQRSNSCVCIHMNICLRWTCYRIWP
jgi:hypothetical protein